MYSPLVISYAKMIKHGFCVLDQVPKEYREGVRLYMEEQSQESSSDDIVQPAIDVPETPNGALRIPKISEVPVKIDDLTHHMFCIEFRSEKIFNPTILGNNPFPIDPKYSVGVVENTFGKFVSTPDVQLKSFPGGFSLEICGISKNVNLGDKLLRIDLVISSFNYEDMHLTMYLVAV